MSDLSVEAFQPEPPSFAESSFAGSEQASAPWSAPVSSEPLFTPIEGPPVEELPSFETGFDDGALFEQRYEGGPFQTSWELDSTPDDIRSSEFAIESTLASGKAESVTGPFLVNVTKKAVEDVGRRLGDDALVRPAAKLFAESGEAGALEAFEALQNARTQTARFGSAVGLMGTLGSLEGELDNVRELADAGLIREAHRHAWGTAGRAFVDGAISLFDKPSKYVGAGNFAKEVLVKTGISEAVYQAFAFGGDLGYETMLGVAVSIHEATGVPLREGVMDEYLAAQARAD